MLNFSIRVGLSQPNAVRTLHFIIKHFFFQFRVMDTESSQASADTDSDIEDSSDDIYEGISELFSLSETWYPDNFRFMDLPQDIRFCIYPYLCQTFHQSYCTRFYYCSCLSQAIPLNKQLYFEMLSFTSTRSNISFEDSTSCYNFFEGIGRERIKYIKRVKIKYLGARSVTQLHFRKVFEALRIANQLEELEVIVEGLMLPPLLEDLEKFVSLRKIIVWGYREIEPDLSLIRNVLECRGLEEGKILEISTRKYWSNEYEWKWELR
ncbi:hypothetical protein ACMFMF_005225 [Clarireedia jacksonii]